MLGANCSKRNLFLSGFLSQPSINLNLRFLRGSNWDVDIGAGLIAGSHRMIQDYYPYMSAGPPSALEHVWSRDLIFSPEMRDDEGRRVVVLRLGQWPPQEVGSDRSFTNLFSQFVHLINFPILCSQLVSLGASLRLLHWSVHPVRVGRPGGENPSGWGGHGP